MAQFKKKDVSRVRIIILAVIMLLIFLAMVFRLMLFQIVDGDDYLEQALTNTSTQITVSAARGDIVDRYGRVLATSKSVFNVCFDYTYTDMEHINETIYSLIGIFEENNIKWLCDIPIKLEGDEYIFDPNSEDSEIEQMASILNINSYASEENIVKKMLKTFEINDYPIIEENGEYSFDAKQEKEVKKLKENLNLDDTATAADCVNIMLQSEEYPYYLNEDAFKIAAVRYLMLQKEFSVNNRYTFATDISPQMIAIVKEYSDTLPGVDVIEEPTRLYLNGDVATNLLGTIGPMYAEDYAEKLEEYEKKKDEGYQKYQMNDYIGKSGVEKVCEEQLRGTKGTISVTQNASGNVVSSETVTQAQTGDTVRLTIDYKFQQKVQEILKNHINTHKVSTAGYTSLGGSVVVLDTKTGEMLACVSYPTYSIEEYTTSYSELKAREETDNPLTDRALTKGYRPGSTFKTVVATAGLQEGVISRYSTVDCTRVYHYYEGFSPTCLGYHGNINVMNALKVSCNIFFYDVGRRLGIDRINNYAELMGLGVDTGLEIYNSDGRLSGPETSEKWGSTWQEGNVVQAAIGQMDTAITPLQMAIQAMTIANKGKRLEAHLIKSVETYNGEVVSETKPVEASSFNMSDDTYKAVTDGMILAASTVPAPYQLTGLGYDVALKTGTPQTNAAGDRTNNCFIAFAPVSDPEIAISCMIEDGTYTNRLVRQILDAYYECLKEAENETAVHYPLELDEVINF